jgi:hypothetical protein
LLRVVQSFGPEFHNMYFTLINGKIASRTTWVGLVKWGEKGIKIKMQNFVTRIQ